MSSGSPSMWLLLSLWAAAAVLVLSTDARAQSACPPKVCSQMRTCAEAYYQLHVCRDLARDGDRDGIPCENVCGKTLVDMIALLRLAPMAGYDFAAIAEAKAGNPGPAGPEHGLQVVASPSSRLAPATAPGPASPAFRCGDKRTCREMSSCEEARFHLTTCGLTALDRNNDGIPCNTLCRGRGRR